MSDDGGVTDVLRFRPNPDPDGAFERLTGAPIPVAAPDWDLALDLLRRLNCLRDKNGQRIPSIMMEDGFEPWWYGQDRLLRFFLVPLTQILPVLEAVGGGEGIRAGNAPPDLERVLRAIGGREGFPSVAPIAPPVKGGSTGKWAMLALTWISLAAFRIARRDTVLYIIDHVSPGLGRDFRLAPLYSELERRGFRYAEYAHTLSPIRAVKNFFLRRRPVVFLEAVDFWARLAHERVSVPNVEFSPASEDSLEGRALRALVPTVLEGCVQSIGRQRMLKRALRFQRAARAVIFDDNRHNHELIAACRTIGLPVLGFQHGVFNKFHAGLMAYGFSGARSHAFERYGVWSGLFRERLLRESALYGADRVFVAGPVRPPEGAVESIDLVREGGAGVTESGKKIRVLVVSEPLARKREVAEFLKVLLEDPRFEMYLKLRPGESDKSLAEYSLPADRVRLLKTGTVYEAFAQVDVAVGTYSTVLYEAALAALPIVWLKTSRAYGRELAEENLAEAAENPESLPEAVEKACSLPPSELSARRERIWGKEIRNGSESLVRELMRMSGG